MDLNLLRSFVVTAEEENVGRAAERLHVTQSPLSRQIQKLEADLGLQLFHRVRKRLRLTAEGRSFLEQARALLNHAEAVEALAGRLAKGEGLPLDIGYVQAALHGGLLPAALRRFGAAGGRIRLRPLRSRAQAEAIANGSLDVGLVHSLPDGPHFRSRLLASDRFLLALPAGHPLAGGLADAAQLDGQPWIALDQAANPAFRARFLDACRRAGFEPDIQYETSDPPTALGLVSSGLGCALVHEGVTRWGLPDGVALQPLPDFSLTIRIFALWRPDLLSPRLERFLAALDIKDGDAP